MKTVSVDIKIPVGHEVEEVSIVWPGYESSPDCAVGKMVVKTKAAQPFLINGVPSDWLELLPASYVAKDQNGKVFAFDSEPYLRSCTWSNDRIASCLSGVISIDIPGPWEQSLRENPRRKK